MPEEQLLTFTMEETLNRVISIVAEGIGFAWGLDGQLQKFINNLTMIQDKLQDAAKRPVTDKSEKLWLERLQDVAYDAKDVLDEFANEILRKEQKKGKVHDFISLRNSVRLSMDRKVEKFTEAINEIWEDAAGSGLGFTFLQHENTAQEPAVDTVETKKLNGAMEMETKTNTHSNLDMENDESSCRISAVDTVETKKLNGAMEMETKTNTHSNLGLVNDESSCKSSAVDTMETKKLNGAMEMETKTNTHSNLGLENTESSCKSSAVDTVETKKLNGAMEMETKTNTHSNLGLENDESSCKSSAVDTVETKKLNGVIEMEIQSCVESVEQGDGVDDVNLVKFSRQNSRYAKLGIPQEAMKGAMKDNPNLNKEDEKEQLLQPSVSPSTPISEFAEVTVGTMGMEPSTNTLSNPNLENAERSCKSKTVEWALLVTSVGLEATSASFDQLGYALTSMVMAFLALFLSILDLILKAQERGITCDGRSLLPCFYRHDVRNCKPFASLIQYFGLVGALWQCSYTTVGYHYTHQKLVNPIKFCLPPFILALCVLISKVVKSSQHDS